jgi:hypothetical protein
MSPFDYALGPVSILVGLALADVAASLHRLLRQARLVRWDVRVVLSVVLVIITITGMWFEVWSIRSVKAMLSYPFYLSLLLSSWCFSLFARLASQMSRRRIAT